mmetsp:Transcript_15109/g.38856  ORF Transcript_15109/g.38856 Transcript_15109/m.38856 type:complete len:216 (-) Transcript_15109:7361-8008(-)
MACHARRTQARHRPEVLSMPSTPSLASGKVGGQRSPPLSASPRGPCLRLLNSSWAQARNSSTIAASLQLTTASRAFGYAPGLSTARRQCRTSFCSSVTRTKGSILCCATCQASGASTGARSCITSIARRRPVAVTSRPAGAWSDTSGLPDGPGVISHALRGLTTTRRVGAPVTDPLLPALRLGRVASVVAGAGIGRGALHPLACGPDPASCGSVR